MHRAARGETVAGRHPARLDNLKFSAFFPKRANVSLPSRILYVLHSDSLKTTRTLQRHTL